MLNKIKIFLDSIIAIINNVGFLLALLIPLIVGSVSYFSTGNPLNYFFAIPWYVWLVILIIVIIGIIYYYFIKTVKTVDYNELISFANEDYLKVIYTYSSVKWKVLIPNNWSTLSDEGIIVDEPPFCPNCQSDLEERSPKFGKKIWSCPSGDYYKKSKESFSSSAAILKKMVKGDVRRNGYSERTLLSKSKRE
jgi:hypothetical protein